MDWDAGLYDQFADERTRPARDAGLVRLDRGGGSMRPTCTPNQVRTPIGERCRLVMSKVGWITTPTHVAGLEAA